MQKFLCIFLLGFTAFTFSQDKDFSNAFKYVWALPNYPDSVLNVSHNKEVSGACPVFFPDSNSIFSRISVMQCDAEDNLYTYDVDYIRKFSPEGKMLFKKDMKDYSETGSGMSAQKNTFAITSNGMMCFAESGPSIGKGGRIVFLDSTGRLIKRININIVPGNIAIGTDSSVYVTGFNMLTQGPLIQHYSFNGEFLGAFCQRDAVIKKNRMSGSSGRLFVNNNGNVYYAFSYPFRVGIFSSKGDSIKVTDRKVPGMKGATSAADRTILDNSLQRGIGIIDNKYIVVVSYLQINKNDWNIDLYTIEGKYLNSIPSSVLPQSFFFKSWTFDSKGNVYFNIETYKGHAVIKYKLNLPKNIIAPNL